MPPAPSRGGLTPKHRARRWRVLVLVPVLVHSGEKERSFPRKWDARR